MRITQPIFIPFRPEVSKSLVESGVFDHPLDGAVWAPPQMAKPAPGSALNSATPTTLPGAGQFHPIALNAPNRRTLARALGLGEAAVPLVEHFAPQVPATALDGVSGVLASAEMIQQWVSPVHMSDAEKILFWGQRTASALNFAADIIPGMHAAKPTLNALVVLCRSGNEVYAVFKENDPVKK
jgi:hypothetical protein